MKASLIKIGNSQGIRIPKPILEQCGFDQEVEIEVKNHEMIIKNPRLSRRNWADSFKKMALNHDDRVIDYLPTEWDDEEWEW